MVNQHENVYYRRGEEGRGHIPALPLWMAIVRIVQFVLTLLIMILAAYASSVFGAGFFPGYGMSFFVFVWTLAFLVYIFVTPLWLPRFYLYWVQLGLEITTVIFWLSTFALLADEAAGWGAVQGALDDVNNDFDGSENDFFPHWNGAINATKAAAALGAINWALFVFTLVMFSISLHKFRQANGATGFGIRHNDVEKRGPTVTEQPIELRHVGDDSQPEAPYA